MKLTQLAAKPQLIKVEINDEQVMAEYNEPLEFWIWDRQDMDTFVKLATIDYTNFAALSDIVKRLILDEEGNPIIRDDIALPSHILMKAIGAVVDTLGKSVSQNTTPQTETFK